MKTLLPPNKLARLASPVVVLVASPSVQDREYLHHVLGEKQIHVIEAGSYRGALAAIGRYGAAAVLCDESLPWRDLLSRLAETCYSPSVIVIAESTSSAACGEVLNLGGCDLLSKPFLREEIELVVGRACIHSDAAPASRRLSNKDETRASTRAATA